MGACVALGEESLFHLASIGPAVAAHNNLLLLLLSLCAEEAAAGGEAQRLGAA